MMMEKVSTIEVRQRICDLLNRVALRQPRLSASADKLAHLEDRQ